MRVAPAMLLAAGGVLLLLVLLLLRAPAWPSAREAAEEARGPDGAISIVRVLADESASTRFSFAGPSYRTVPFGAYALDTANMTVRFDERVDAGNVTSAFLLMRPYDEALGGWPEELALAIDGGGPASIWVNGTPTSAIDQRISVDATRAHIHFWRLHGCVARFFDEPQTTDDVAPHVYLIPEHPTGSVEFLGGASELGACPQTRLDFAWIGAWRVRAG